MINPSRNDFFSALRWVFYLNLVYFFIEFLVAFSISSVSLYSDSLDFLEDALVSLLILLSFRFSKRFRANLGLFLSVLFIFPAFSALFTVWRNITYGIIPHPLALSLTGLGALIINLVCAFMMARHRHSQGSLSKLAFYSARNDALANIFIIISGILTRSFDSTLPDIITGLGIFLMNITAAKEVYLQARKEKAEF